MQGHLSMIIQPDISPVLCLSVTVNDDIFKLTWMKLNLGHDWLVWFLLIDSIHVTVRAGRALVGRAGSARPARLEKKGENTSSHGPSDHKNALAANRPSRRRLLVRELAFGNDVCFGSEAILYIKTILCSDASLYSLTTLHAHHTLHPLVRARLRLKKSDLLPPPVPAQVGWLCFGRLLSSGAHVCDVCHSFLWLTCLLSVCRQISGRLLKSWALLFQRWIWYAEEAYA